MKFQELRTTLQEKSQQQSQNSSIVDRRLVRAVGANYNKVVLAIRKLGKNPNPLSLPNDLRKHYNAYMAAVVTAATRLAQSGGGTRYFKENLALESLNENFDPPLVLILKRKTIRDFIGGKKVALYANDPLGLTFTVQYDSRSGKVDNNSPMVSEEAALNHLCETFELSEAVARMIRPNEAHKLLKVFNSLNDKNKEAMRNHIKDPEMIDDVLKFVHKHASMIPDPNKTKTEVKKKTQAAKEKIGAKRKVPK